MQFFDGLGVITKIHLAADKDDRKALAEVKDFGDPLEKKKQKVSYHPLIILVSSLQRSVLFPYAPTETHLLLNVVERVWRVYRETDEDDMGVRIGQRTETVIIFLARRIPKGEFDVLAIHFDIGDVVLKDGGDVDLCYTGLAGRAKVWLIEMVSLE